MIKKLFFLDENEKSQHAEGAECSFFGPKTLLKGKLEEGSSCQDGIYDVQSDSSTVKEGKTAKQEMLVQQREDQRQTKLAG